MKKRIIITGSFLLLVTAAVVKAQDSSMDYQRDPGDLYRKNELSLDLFGGGTLDEHDIDRVSGDRIHNNGRLGLGGGLNYFFLRNVGVGGDVYAENPDHSFIDEASGSLILRFPIGRTGLAPYVFGGGGHQFDPQPATFGHAGVGLEFRFNPNVGVFTDARWVATDRIGDYGLARAGFRFAF